MHRALALLALTTTASAQWTLQNSGTTASLRGIHSLGNGVAWASGTGGTVLRTEDGGKNWHLCNTPPDAEKLDFRGVQAFDAKSAIVMSSGKGELSRLYKTTDGCQTWKLVFTNPDPDGFWDLLTTPYGERNEIALIGDPVNGVFPMWWSTYPGDAFGRFSDKLRANADEALFAASNSSMFSSSVFHEFWLGTGGVRGGRIIHYKSRVLLDGDVSLGTASEVPVGNHTASSGVFSLQFRPDTRRPKIGFFSGVAVGGDYLKPNEATNNAAFTTNGGKTWQTATTAPHGYRSAVAYDASTKTWITVGPNGTDVSTDDGRNWHALKPGPTDAPDADKNWNALSLPFVVGSKGRIGILRPAALEASAPPHR